MRSAGSSALIVSHEASRTGAPRVAGEVARALRENGWEVVIVHRWSGPLAGWLDECADRSIVPPLNRVRAALQTIRALAPVAGALESAAVRWVLWRTRPDLVWCNTVVTSRWATGGAALRIPAVLMSHETDPRWVSDRVKGLDTSVALAACSRDVADVLAAAVGVEADTITVLRPPVDVRALAPFAVGSDRPPGTRPLVVGCGVGDRRKGVDVFASAASLAKARGLEADWRWVGRKPAVPLQSPVEWLGEVENSASAIASADVFTLPSRAEGFPLVVLEAMALGRPIVASDLPGPREQLGPAGVLVPPGDEAALAAAVSDLLDDPDRARALGAEAAARCRAQWDRPPFVRAVAATADRVVTQRPVRVAHLIGRLSEGGGVQVVIRRLAAHLDADRVELEVVTLRPRIDADHVDDVAVNLHPLGYGRVGFRLRDRLRLTISIARTMWSIKPDVVHVHSGLGWLGYGARLVAPRVPVILEVHDAPGSGRHGRGTDRLEGAWVRRLGAVAVAHSSSVAQAVEQRWKPPAGRLVTFPLAVDTERFRPREHGHRREWRQRHQIPEEAVLVVSVGRFVPSKRFESLVEALAGSRTPAILLLIGGGPLEPDLRALIRALDLDGRVWMPGPLYDAELADALGAADILCSPSEYEGFGLTLIEGMACGLPVIARAVGGVTDVVEDGVTGHLLASSAPDVWASAIDRLAHDADGRRRLGAAGRARAVAEFSLDHFVGSFTMLYEHAARRSASSVGGRSPERPGR